MSNYITESIELFSKLFEYYNTDMEDAYTYVQDVYIQVEDDLSVSLRNEGSREDGTLIWIAFNNFEELHLYLLNLQKQHFTNGKALFDYLQGRK